MSCHETALHDLLLCWGTKIKLPLNVASVPEESTEVQDLHIPLHVFTIMSEAEQSIAL